MLFSIFNLLNFIAILVCCGNCVKKFYRPYSMGEKRAWASTTKPQELSSSNWGRLLELVKILQKVLIWWINYLKTLDS